MSKPTLLGHRDFMLWIGETLLIGAPVSTVAFPLLVLAQTGSVAKAGEDFGQVA